MSSLGRLVSCTSPPQVDGAQYRRGSGGQAGHAAPLGSTYTGAARRPRPAHAHAQPIDGRPQPAALSIGSSAAAGALPDDETPQQQIDRLQARVRELEVESTKLTSEREILRSAAKYFAAETNW